MSAVGSIETRPWLPSGMALGFTSKETRKHDYPDADERKARGEDHQYDKRVGRAVVVRVDDRDSEIKVFDTEAKAKTWAEKLSGSDAVKLLAEVVEEVVA